MGGRPKADRTARAGVRKAAEGSPTAPLVRLLTAKSAEQSENVYENKGAAWKSTTPDPSLSKEGNSGLPSSDEEG